MIRVLTTAALVTAFAVAAPVPVVASSSAVTDEVYLRLARCAALESLVASRGAFYERLREVQKGRSSEVRFEAESQARRLRATYDATGGDGRKAMQAELRGACAVLLGGEQAS